MLIQPITVSPWQSNCYLVRRSEEDVDTLIIDPGMTAFAPVREIVEAGGLRPRALLATHGHFDHIGDAYRLADHFGIPLFLARPDQHLVTRPGAGLGPRGDAMVAQFTGSAEAPPVADVRDHVEPSEIAGLTVTPFPAPGHTLGSTLLTVSDGETQVVFTGDVLFRGTIGRTDLPGGSMIQMRETLARIVAEFPAGVKLLPGHGEPTSLAEEIASNPYLQNL
ncbi:Glyoxylase, beta-lactamase superfamily II [Tessaracoccus bendigoensis DSM 12906]|uniref:Glyoxylase, beta-lactamase superfamily II n=1 Tax=Tessaracoccus bendigoensis DSM 12906 TaxID=1123357 RepID=A0A1M6N7Z9_9ACTN|nr:MBL fold metallo-hydrolase [Tessaracoccus bendigoensis]SHJ91811.1 Glyoxylase, beta-lactamase superfamily II [Tessaracoccus bendigoensis DSM 12906]